MSEMHLSRGPSGSRRLFLAFPTYTGQLPARVCVALVQSVLALEKAGIACDIAIEAGNCHVDDCRNALVRQFLLSDADRMLFIDADVCWRPEELVRFVQHREDVVAGVYPKKRDGADWPLIPLAGPRLAHDGLVEVAAVPTGFLMLSRACLEALSKDARAYYGREDDPDDLPYRLLFERTWEPVEGAEHGRRWGGDFAFCRKWTSVGGRIYVDPEMTFDHEGHNRWSGRLAEHWLEQEEAATKRLAKHLKRGDWKRAAEAYGNEGWSGSPELLGFVSRAAESAVGPIVDIGSGLTTLAAARHAAGVVLALEHDPAWAETTASRVNACGLGGKVHVVCAPLGDRGGPTWYDIPESRLPDSIGLLIIDGPPRHLGDRAGCARLASRLMPGATIIADDADPEMTWRLGNALGVDFEVIEAAKPFAVATAPEAAAA